MSSKRQKKVETIGKLAQHFGKDPSNISETTQYLTVADFARFFKQLTDPDREIRQISLQIVVYLMCANYEGKKQLLSGIHLEAGACIFNPINSEAIKTHKRDPNIILQRANAWMESQSLKTQILSPTSAKQKKINKNKIFENCGTYHYATDTIQNFSQVYEGKPDPLQYLIFSMVKTDFVTLLQEKQDKPKINIKESFNGNQSINFERSFEFTHQQRFIRNSSLLQRKCQ